MEDYSLSNADNALKIQNDLRVIIFYHCDTEFKSIPQTNNEGSFVSHSRKRLMKRTFLSDNPKRWPIRTKVTVPIEHQWWMAWTNQKDCAECSSSETARGYPQMRSAVIALNIDVKESALISVPPTLRVFALGLYQTIQISFFKSAQRRSQTFHPSRF